MKIGIIGLPNVGKSTLFKILSGQQIAIENYPFTTIEPNIAIVPVPDERLKKLSEIIKSQKVTPATIEFVDVAGLVKEAHQGKGLGNQFLAKIREADLLIEVVREFEDKNVPHVEGTIDQKRDIEIIAKELKEADINQPIIYLFNKNLKEELAIYELSKQEQEELQIKPSGLIENLIKRCFDELGLITFYTIKGRNETRASKLKKGQNILEAAEKIHSDFKEKFIKAEIISYDDFIKFASIGDARQKGLLRTEGKEYVMHDGDIVEFKI